VIDQVLQLDAEDAFIEEMLETFDGESEVSTLEEKLPFLSLRSTETKEELRRKANMRKAKKHDERMSSIYNESGYFQSRSQQKCLEQLLSLAFCIMRVSLNSY
jgi:hypothetical protein